MIKFLVVVREPGKLAPDYSLGFEAPALPREGDYLSVQRPDHERPFGEDMIVAKVWWRLSFPETGPFLSDPPEVGALDEIYVECVPAIGPYSSDWWRDSLERRGAPKLKVSRISYRESEIAEARKAVAEMFAGRSTDWAGAGPDEPAEADAGTDFPVSVAAPPVLARLWSAWKGYIRNG